MTNDNHEKWSSDRDRVPVRGDNVEPLGRQWYGEDDARLPPEMAERADARELRAFLTAFLSIDDPADRRRILKAVESATS